MPDTSYDDAVRIVREHEAATLARFKAELAAVIDRYSDAPGARELAWTVRERAGLGPTSADRHRSAAEGLRQHLKPLAG